VHAHAVDLVVSDIEMPGMRGLDLLEQLRRARPTLPVVLITAFGTVDLAVQAMRAIRRASESLVELYVGPGQHPQAITQEFGTSFHPPQPFMRPAWDQTQRPMIEDIKRELWADIQRTAARAARRAARQTAG
jgi:CheY-like chemotaxis protein